MDRSIVLVGALLIAGCASGGGGGAAGEADEGANWVPGTYILEARVPQLSRGARNFIEHSAELVIDTTRMSVYALREQIRERVAPRAPGALSIMIESFGYKNGLPANADFVFDVRCLPNPYWEPQLRPLSGKDAPVRAFLDSAPMVQRMVDDIAAFLEEWIPRYQDFQRSYLTVAIGCTGGMHRSVYVAEAVAKRLASKHKNIRTHHSEVH